MRINTKFENLYVTVTVLSLLFKRYFIKYHSSLNFGQCTFKRRINYIFILILNLNFQNSFLEFIYRSLLHNVDDSVQ